MPKEYQFICPGCGTLFTTVMKDRAYCRLCISAGRAKLGDRPVPSPLQEAKWKAGRRAKKLMNERETKIESSKEQHLVEKPKEQHLVERMRTAKAGDIIIQDEEWRPY